MIQVFGKSKNTKPVLLGIFENPHEAISFLRTKYLLDCVNDKQMRDLARYNSIIFEKEDYAALRNTHFDKQSVRNNKMKSFYKKCKKVDCTDEKGIFPYQYIIFKN